MRKAIGTLCVLAAVVAAPSVEAYMAPRRDNSAVVNALTSVSQRYGIPMGTLLAFGRIESGLRPRARTGSYKGLFQMSDKEFRKHGGGNIYDAQDNAEAFARLTLANMAIYRAKTGRNPTGSELYLMHQQGTAGAAAHMRRPADPAWKNMASTAEGRRKGPRWAKKAIWGNVPTSWKRRFGSVENITSGDFMEMWGRNFREKQGWKGSIVASTDSPRIPTRARSALDADTRDRGLRTASENLKLNARERKLYQRHLTNLYGPGGVTGEMGNRSTLMATTVGFGGRTYLIPTVWDGKILSDDQAILKAKQLGLRNFPKYKSVQEAEARYQKMHDYMDMDVEAYTNAQFSPTDPTNYRENQAVYSELDTQSAEMAAGRLPPPPPSFRMVIGGKTAPEPFRPGSPNGSPDTSVIASRKPDETTSQAGQPFFTEDRLDSVFGKPFGQLYAEGRIPKPPAKPLLLRDLFGAA